MSLSIDERFGLDVGPEQPPHPFFLAGKAAGRKDAVEWLRARAAKTEAEVGDDCDGQDADRLCNEASLLYGAANDFARGSEP